MYEMARVKVAELESSVSQQDRSTLGGDLRIISRISHVRNRIRHLVDLGADAACTLGTEGSSLMSRLAALERDLLPHLTTSGRQAISQEFPVNVEDRIPKAVSDSDMHVVDDPLRPSKPVQSEHIVAPFDSPMFRKLTHPIEGLIKRIAPCERIRC
jgi:hypothetical protein